MSHKFTKGSPRTKAGVTSPPLSAKNGNMDCQARQMKPSEVTAKGK